MKLSLLPTLILVLACLGGCARSPERQYFTLRSNSPQTPSTGLSQPKQTIAITAVSVPESVDSNKIVTRVAGSSRLEISDQNRWAESLAAEIATALADELEHLFKDALVTTPGQSSLLAHADHQLDIDITRFEGTLGGGVELEAIWTIREPKGSPTRHGQARITESLQGSDYESLTTAYKAALKRLSVLIRNTLETR